MSTDLTKRVIARVTAATEDDDGPHDPKDGVLQQWQYDALEDKSAWKGYRYSLATWEWAAENYEDQDEPDSFGDSTRHGPLKTLDEVLAVLKKSPFKWGKWIAKSDGSFQSGVKKTKKSVTQGIVDIERVDGKPLSYEEQEHIEDALRLK